MFFDSFLVRIQERGPLLLSYRMLLLSSQGELIIQIPVCRKTFLSEIFLLSWVARLVDNHASVIKTPHVLGQWRLL